MKAKAKPAPGPVSDSDSLSQDDFLVRETLRELCRDTTAPPAARAQAARTLAELVGLLGRHQDKPSEAGLSPLSSLSPAELRAELQRLQGLTR